MSPRSELLGTPIEQLGALLQHQAGETGASLVSSTYPVILGLRCSRCGSGAGVRCSTASGQITYPHAARIEDAVAFVAHLIRVDARVREHYKGSAS